MRVAAKLTRAFASAQVVALIALGVFGLCACGEKPQTAGTASKKHDAKASEGGAGNAYAVGGWKPGDQASWDQEIKARNQNQNEYTKAR